MVLPTSIPHLHCRRVDPCKESLVDKVVHKDIMEIIFFFSKKLTSFLYELHHNDCHGRANSSLCDETRALCVEVM